MTSTNSEKEGGLLEKIKQCLEVEEGDIKLGVSVLSEGDQIIILLFYNDLLSHYLSIQLKDRICYINKLDSTGITNGIGKDFLKGVFSSFKSETLCCFSHPKPVYIFRTPMKRLLRPFDLGCYWVDVLSRPGREIMAWGNISTDLQRRYPLISKGYPYKAFVDVVYFDDDPKTRIKKHLEINNLDNLFTTLLCRKDFVEGCLIYSINKASRDSYISLEGFEEVSSFTKYLMALDLSTFEKLEEESQKLKDKFDLEIAEFKYKKKEKGVLKEEQQIILKPKRRKL